MGPRASRPAKAVDVANPPQAAETVEGEENVVNVVAAALDTDRKNALELIEWSREQDVHSVAWLRGEFSALLTFGRKGVDDKYALDRVFSPEHVENLVQQDAYVNTEFTVDLATSPLKLMLLAVLAGARGSIKVRVASPNVHLDEFLEPAGEGAWAPSSTVRHGDLNERVLLVRVTHARFLALLAGWAIRRHKAWIESEAETE